MALGFPAPDKGILVCRLLYVPYADLAFRKLCMYCGEISSKAFKMLICVSCGLAVCAGGPLDCIHAQPGIPLEQSGFKCPLCCRKAKQATDVSGDFYMTFNVY